MNEQFISAGAIAAASALSIVVIMASVYAKRSRKIDKTYYQSRWQDLQKLLRDQATWPLAIIDADKLLDDALKANKFKGKTMGERLVAAQRQIQANDDVWFGHKLRNRLVHENDVKIKERDVKEALLGIRHALKDLGAL